MLAKLPEYPEKDFEVILDYKGMRRPIRSKGPALFDRWHNFEWQVMTYAHLRSTHRDALPIAAGVIVYLNELQPRGRDITALQQELRDGSTDIAPTIGSPEYDAIMNWRNHHPLPQLPLEFRLRRALHVIPVSPGGVAHALDRFDEIVARIEQCHINEERDGAVIAAWEKNSEDEATCEVCDFRTFCPSYIASFLKSGQSPVPQLPRQ